MKFSERRMDGVTGDYCFDVYAWKTDQVVYVQFALWLTFTLSMVLLLRLRFWHSVFVSVPACVVQVVWFIQFVLSTGVWEPVGVVTMLIMFYIPAMFVCLGAPYIHGRLDYSNYLHVQYLFPSDA